MADDSWAGRPAPDPQARPTSRLVDPDGPTRSESRLLVVGYLISAITASFVVAGPVRQAVESDSSPSGGWLVTFAVIVVVGLGLEAIRYRVARRTGGRFWMSNEREDFRFAMSAVRNSGWPRVVVLGVLVTATAVYVVLFLSLLFGAFHA